MNAASENAEVNGFESPVWLLDDEQSTLKATKRLLNSAGWEVEAFTDPSFFLQEAKTQRPRLAVIDMWMPVMHGLEVQEKLNEVSPATRVIVLTGKDDPNIRSRALEAGAAAFFLKPVSGDDFLASIQSAFATAAAK
jgi:two-component system phosphoglycerate transport system response regulator PgtA